MAASSRAADDDEIIIELTVDWVLAFAGMTIVGGRGVPTPRARGVGE